MDEDQIFVLCHVGGICIGVGGAVGVAIALLGWVDLAHPTLVLVVGACFASYGFALLLLAHWRSPLVVQHVTLLAGFALLGTVPALTLGQLAIGPASTVTAIFYVVVPVFAYFMMSSLRAWLLTGLVSVMFGSVMLLQDGYRLPQVTWLTVTAAVATTGYVFGKMLKSARDEAERSAQLRRFLAPAVADAVLSGEAEDVLRRG